MISGVIRAVLIQAHQPVPPLWQLVQKLDLPSINQSFIQVMAIEMEEYPLIDPGPIQLYISKSTAADVKNYDGSGQWAKLGSLTATFSSGSVTWLAQNTAEYSVTLPSSLGQ